VILKDSPVETVQFFFEEVYNEHKFSPHLNTGYYLLWGCLKGRLLERNPYTIEGFNFAFSPEIA